MLLRQPYQRPGLSLLEVLVSLAIFLFSLVGLSFLVGSAGNMAQEAHFRSQAALHCQTILDEVIGGAIGLESQSDVPIEDDPDYHYSLDIESGPAQGLYSVTVHVRRTRANGQEIEVSLAQLILDPKVVGSHLDAPGAIAESDTTLSSGTTDSSGSSGSTGSTGATSAPTTNTAAASGGGGTGGGTTAAAAPRTTQPSGGTSANSAARSPAPAATTPRTSGTGTPAGNTGNTGTKGSTSTGGAKGSTGAAKGR